MKTTAIHQHDDWYSVQISGLGSSQKSKIEVEINITDKEFLDMDYKTLRGLAILERYEEKEQRQIDEETIPLYISLALSPDELINSTEDLIQKVKTLPNRNDIYPR